MKTITIEIPEPDDEKKHFDVVLEDGRRCDGLCFGAMLEQITHLAFPMSIRKEAYPMKTREEWDAHWKVKWRKHNNTAS